MNRSARILGGLVACVGAAALIGWFGDVAALRGVRPGLATMKVNTALAFILSGLATVLHTSPPEARGAHRIARLLGAAVLAMAGLTLGEWMAGVSFGIDELWVADPTGHPPGRMAAGSAFGFLLSGAALTAFDHRIRGHYRPAQYFAVGVAFLGLVGLQGYLFGVAALYRVFLFSSMALHTALGFLALGLAMLLARSDVGFMRIVTGKGPGSRLARRIIPAVFAAPILLVWLRLAGQRAGLFDPEIGAAVTVVVTIVGVFLLIMYAAEMVNRYDVAQRGRDEQLARVEHLEVLGQMTAGIAHDFNNLLMIVLMSARSARSLRDPGHVQDALDAIEVTAQRASRLVEELMVYARRERSALETLDLDAVLRDVEPMLRRLIAPIELTVVTGVGEVISGRRSEIERVLVNLVVNARDAISGLGEVTLETREVELDGPGLLRGAHVLLSVTDTGRGMDAATLARVFEPFFTTKPEGSGTGLGLSTVKKLVEERGGSLWAYSEPGVGTTFKIYFPRAVAPEEALDDSGRSEEAPRGVGTVLLAEDDPTLRLMCRDWLERLGYRVIEVDPHSVGRLGLDGADILVTDVILPGSGGARLAAEVRDKLPALRVLYMSGIQAEPLKRSGLLVPDAPFLEKPFGPKELAHAVRSALEAAS